MGQEYVRSDIDRLKDLYTIICNGELGDDEESVYKRVCIVRELEQKSCSDFQNTSDFHHKIG